MSWTQAGQLSAGKLADRALPDHGLDRDPELCTITFFCREGLSLYPMSVLTEGKIVDLGHLSQSGLCYFLYLVVKLADERI